MNYFLEPYEKIKKLRSKYKITQKELAGELYTQGYITALERGVKKLTDKNIVELVGRFNEILEEKGIGDRIKVEDVKMDKTESETIFIERLINEITGINSTCAFLQKK